MTSKYNHARTYRVMMKNKVNDVQSFAHFWDPFEKVLGSKKTIYVSLDGVYNQVNLNTLKKTGGDFLIKKYDFVLLSNLRDILDRNEKANRVAEKNATLIGFPDYGSGILVQVARNKKRS